MIILKSIYRPTFILFCLLLTLNVYGQKSRSKISVSVNIVLCNEDTIEKKIPNLFLRHPKSKYGIVLSKYDYKLTDGIMKLFYYSTLKDEKATIDGIYNDIILPPYNCKEFLLEFDSEKRFFRRIEVYYDDIEIKTYELYTH